jgi:hypothetical protein
MTLEEARKILGLAKLASRHEIRSAYRQEARRWHPDRALDRRDEVKFRDRMQQVNLAYQRIIQFIEDYRFELEENSSQEDLMQWWRNRFATGVWSPPPPDDREKDQD